MAVHRFGAAGKYERLAVIERSVQTLKAECIRRLIPVQNPAENRHQGSKDQFSGPFRPSKRR